MGQKHQVGQGQTDLDGQRFHTQEAFQILRAWAGAGPEAGDEAAARSRRLILQAHVPAPPPNKRNGSLGMESSADRATSTPAASNTGSALPKIWRRNCAPSRASELARVAIMPPEMDIIRAGITVTSPSPIVSTV